MAEDSSPSLGELYDEYDLDRRYDHPNKVTTVNSYFGKGKYPPDWGGEKRPNSESTKGGRREAIYKYQDGKCARCQTDLENRSHYHCHHYRPIDAGGKHDLNNLVVLCGPCHKLIHPDVDDLSSDWRDAQMFPSPEADPRMATIRKPVTNSEKEQFYPELKLLESISRVGENEFATSDATIAVSPGDALRAAEDWEQFLRDAGIDFDSNYEIRVSNSDGGPIYNADVGLTITVPNYGTFNQSVQTNEFGMASFSIPAEAQIRASVVKDGFEDYRFQETVEGDKEFEIKLTQYSEEEEEDEEKPHQGQDSGEVNQATQQNPQAEDTSSSTSRRSYLKWGAIAAIGIGGWSYWKGSLPVIGSSTSANDSSTSANTISPDPIIPLWSLDLRLGAAVTHIEQFQSDRLIAGLETGEIFGIGLDGKIFWNLDLNQKLTGLSVSDNSIYVNAGNSIYSISNGNVDWSSTIEGVNSNPFLDMGVNSSQVIVTYNTSESGVIRVLDQGSGEKLREFEAFEPIQRQIEVSGSTLVQASSSEIKIVDDVLNTKPDEIKQIDYGGDAKLWSDININDNRAYISLVIDDMYPYTKSIRTFDISSATTLWKFQFGREDAIMEPAVGRNQIYYSDNYGTVVLDKSGVRMWKKDIQSTMKPLIDNNVVYFGGWVEGWGFSAHVKSNGKQLFEERSLKNAPQSSITAGDQQIFGTAGGRLNSYKRTG